MSSSGKTQADLLPVLGQPSHVSEAVNGTRPISAPQARKLGRMFRVEPGYFSRDSHILRAAACGYSNLKTRSINIHFSPGFASGSGLWNFHMSRSHSCTLGLRAVRLGLRIERKPLVHFHDHEHARAQEVNLHVLDAGVANALRDLRPNPLMMPPVFRDQLRIVLAGRASDSSAGSCRLRLRFDFFRYRSLRGVVPDV